MTRCMMNRFCLVLIVSALLLLAGCGGGATPAAEKYNQAIDLIKKGDPAAALPLLRDAEKAEPDNLHIQTALGQCLHELGRFDEALVPLKKALKTDPKHAIALRAMARGLRDLGRLKEADGFARRALDTEPDSFTGTMLAADIAYRLGDFPRAEQLGRSLIRSWPEQPIGHYVLAEALVAAGRHEEAAAEYEQALAADPLNLVWAEHHQDCLMYAGKAAQAEACYTRLADAHPDAPAAQYLLARLLPADRSAEKLALLDKAIAINAAFTRARDEKAALFLQLGQLDKARAELDDLFASATPDADSYHLRGLYRQRVGEYGAAIEDLKRAAGPTDLAPRRHLELVRTYLESDRYADADVLLNALDAAVGKQPPYDFLLPCWRARLAEAQGDFDAAAEIRRSLLARTHGAADRVTVYYENMKMELTRGDWEAAAKAGAAALDAGPDASSSAELELWIGVAEQFAGHGGAARAAWRAADVANAAPFVRRAAALLAGPNANARRVFLADETALRYDQVNDQRLIAALAAEMAGDRESARGLYEQCAATSRGEDFPKQLAIRQLRSESRPASEPVG
jgi:tetratricopeptide (TPR) repeat protein